MNAVISGSWKRSSVPSSPNRHSSIISAVSENREKLVPFPSNVAPRGNG
jgi:hypothetical protein